jgi:hypothetical protein
MNTSLIHEGIPLSKSQSPYTEGYTDASVILHS